MAIWGNLKVEGLYQRGKLTGQMLETVVLGQHVLCVRMPDR